MRFFNLGAAELLLILLFAILAVGPKETIRLAGQVREMIKSAQSALNEITAEVTRAATEVMEAPEDYKAGD